MINIEKFDPDDYIKWTELSRLMVGSFNVLRRNRIPKKHLSAVNELRRLIVEWHKKNFSDQDKKSL